LQIFALVIKVLYKKQICLCVQDFENDVKLLKRVLAFALKQKKKYLICEKCGAMKRSVDGFISHMQFCGKSEEVSMKSIIIYYILYADMYFIKDLSYYYRKGKH